MKKQSHLKNKQKSKKSQITVEIIEYKPEYRIHYKNLNYEWLEKYFEIESIDEKILSNPEKEIIEKNGFIFFALLEDNVIGTCTLMKHDNAHYELSKMCVTEKYQGKGVGEKLIDTVISKASQLGVEKIVLSTNSKLIAAFSLYKKKGFQIIENPLALNSNYKRESIHMCLNLNDNCYRENKKK
ncbi:Amino-acid acetyltransferase [uncultured archaeon]|nr:Amino-acid acetyltransferase [uncultured archaeon]